MPKSGSKRWLLSKFICSPGLCAPKPWRRDKRRDMGPIGRSTRIFVTAALLAATAPLTAQRGPAPAMSHLPAEVLALACSPSLVFEEPSPALLITGGQDSFTHHSYAAGDLITINAG